MATFLPKPNFPKPSSHPSYPRFRINLMVPLRLARSARNQGSRLHFSVENIDHLVSRLIGGWLGEKKPRRPRCARRIRSSRLERPITPWARISVIISRSPDGDKYRLGALAVDSRGVPARDALAERFTSRYHGCPPRWRCHRAASRAHCVRNSSLQQRFTAGRLPRYLPSCSGQMRGLRRSSPLSPRPQALPSPG